MCVCDTIILAGKSRWLGIAQDITHSDMDFHLIYTHIFGASQPEAETQVWHQSPPTLCTKALLSTNYKFYSTGFKVMCKSLTAKTIEGIFRPHIGLFSTRGHSSQLFSHYHKVDFWCWKLRLYEEFSNNLFNLYSYILLDQFGQCPGKTSTILDLETWNL